MKKLFTFVFLVVAIVSFGGITRPVHADTTLTPAQAAALQTQLDGLKASLAKLQAQAASPSVPVQPQPSVLATEDAAALRSALSSLAAVLGNLQTRFAADPELATRNAPVVFSALQGMAKTLTVIGTAIGGANASPVAVAQPAAPGKAFAQATPAPVAAPVPTAPAALAPPATPATPLISANADQAVNTNQVAQIGSSSPFKNMNWPLILVVVLVVGAVALWLFWPESGAKRKPVKLASSAPPAPIVTAMPQQPQMSHQPLLQQQHQQHPPQPPQQQRRSA